jgi:hypothetical protein
MAGRKPFTIACWQEEPGSVLPAFLKSSRQQLDQWRIGNSKRNHQSLDLTSFDAFTKAQRFTVASVSEESYQLILRERTGISGLVLHDRHRSSISRFATEECELYDLEFATSGIKILFDLKFDRQFLGDWLIGMKGVIGLLGGMAPEVNRKDD